MKQYLLQSTSFASNKALEQEFHYTQSHDMFWIFILGPSGKPHDINNIKYMFVDWMHITPEQIIESCALFSLYSGDATWNEDFIWSWDTIYDPIKDKDFKKHLLVVPCFLLVCGWCPQSTKWLRLRSHIKTVESWAFDSHILAIFLFWKVLQFFWRW